MPRVDTELKRLARARMAETGENYTQARHAIIVRALRTWADPGTADFRAQVGASVRRSRRARGLTVTLAASRAGLPKLRWDLLERGSDVALTPQDVAKMIAAVRLDPVAAYALQRCATRHDPHLAALTRIVTEGFSIEHPAGRSPQVTAAVHGRSIVVAEWLPSVGWTERLPGDVEIRSSTRRHVAGALAVPLGPARDEAIRVLEDAHPPRGDWIGDSTIIELSLRLQRVARAS